MPKKASKPRPNVFSKGYAPYGTTTVKGSPENWKAAFEERMMGLDEAVAVLDKDNPYSILGLAQGADKAAIKTAFRHIVATQCKDAFGLNPPKDQEDLFKKVHAAYSFLMKS